jgi:putative ABC transport system permease protein
MWKLVGMLPVLWTGSAALSARGASVGQIVGLITKEFLILMLLALIVGDALGYWLTLSLLDSIYAYHAAVGTLALVAANAVTLIVAGVTAVIIVYRAAIVNPVSSLRYE